MLQWSCFLHTYMYHVGLSLLTFKLSYFKCHAKFCYNETLNCLRLQIFFSWILKFLWFYIQFEVDLTKVQNRGFIVFCLTTLCSVLGGHCHWTENVSSVSGVEARLQLTHNPEHQNPYFHHYENLKTSLFMKSILIFNVHCCKTIYCWKSKEKHNSLVAKILTLCIVYLLKHVSVSLTSFYKIDL